ncbi:MAG: hypothetical protein AB1411_15975 [Nitrospirota bacterium]
MNIVIEVKHGMVQAVYADDPARTSVHLVDWDNIRMGEETSRLLDSKPLSAMPKDTWGRIQNGITGPSGPNSKPASEVTMQAFHIARTDDCNETITFHVELKGKRGAARQAAIAAAALEAAGWDGPYDGAGMDADWEDQE